MRSRADLCDGARDAGMEAVVEADLDEPARSARWQSIRRSISRDADPGRLLDQDVRAGVKRSLGELGRAGRGWSATTTTSACEREQLLERRRTRSPPMVGGERRGALADRCRSSRPARRCAERLGALVPDQRRSRRSPRAAPRVIALLGSSVRAAELEVERRAPARPPRPSPAGCPRVGARRRAGSRRRRRRRACRRSRRCRARAS